MNHDKIKILLVEDDEDDFIITRDFVSQIGQHKFSLEWIKTYEEAIKILPLNTYDIYIVDYRLGERNGVQLLQEASSLGCEAPVIVLTGQEDHETDIEAMMSGAADYLIKSQLNSSLLERSIRYAIEWKKTQERFKKLNSDLEKRVRQRTAQLEEINSELNKEILIRKKVEQSLRKNKERLELAQKAGNIGSFEWDIVNDKFRWSKELKKLYSCNFKGQVSKYKDWFERVHPVDSTKLQILIDDACKNRCEISTEFRIIWPDKGVRWIACRAEFFCDKDNNPIAMVGINRDVTERKQAENSLKFLAQVGTELTASLDYQTTLNTITQLAVPTLADWCVVDILENQGMIRRLSVAHIDPSKTKILTELNQKHPSSLNSPEGIGKVIATKKSEIYSDISDELLHKITDNEDRFRVLKEVGFESCMIVPLIRKGVCLGTIKFALATRSRKYLISDLTLAEDLAYKAAVAVENAQFYNAEQISRKEAQIAEKRMRSLQSLTAALSESLTLEQVSKASINEGLKVLGADAGCIGIINHKESTIDLVNSHGYQKEIIDQWSRFSLDSKTPLATAIRNKKLLILQTKIKRNKKFPNLSKYLDSIGKETLISIPLIVKDEVLGAFGLHFDKSMKFLKEDKALILAVGQQCAQALDRARLYESELQSREQKEVLLKEIHHRVKNNLQIISSLLNLQSRKIKDKKYLEVFKESQNRVRSMSLVHEKLYQSKDLGNIDFKQYINQIASNLFRSYASINGNIRLEINMKESILLSVDTATPCGLIINELLSNSLKYAFPKGKDGIISIDLSYNDNIMMLQVSDNGIGLPENFDIQKTESLGLKLITMLVDQINGTFKIENSNGTCAHIEFPFVRNNNMI